MQHGISSSDIMNAGNSLVTDDMKHKTKKFFKKTHKKAKKKAKFLLRHPFVLPVSIFFVVVFFGMGLFVTAGATNRGANDKKIVDIYVDGEKQTISTRAKTVEDLLVRLEISTIPEDIVEPARDTVFLEDNTQVNIYRARPVELIDGDRIISVLSAQKAPRLVAAEAGIELLPEDDVIVGRSDESVLSSSASEQIIIDRSVIVQLNVYGVLTTVRTTADTVMELLERENISLLEGENTQPENVSTAITPGMFVSVNRPGVKTLSIIEPIPFDSETKTDPNIDTGNSNIEVVGVDGERAVIYEIKEENGVEVSRIEIQTIVTKNPVTQVTVRGSKQATLSSRISVSADKIALMAAAGISEADYAYVDFIISHESGWRPGAINSSSGAYGLCQSLPASKMASAGADYLTNPVTQMRWCSSYTARYGGWQGSYNAWLVQGWW